MQHTAKEHAAKYPLYYTLLYKVRIQAKIKKCDYYTETKIFAYYIAHFAYFVPKICE